MTPCHSSSTCPCSTPPTYPSSSSSNLNSTSTSISTPKLRPPSTTTSEHNGKATFTLFALLPPEVRLRIWSVTLPPPRLVPLTYLSTSALSPNTPKSHRGCTSPAAIPVTLQICRESRNLALQHYTLSFGLSGGISYPGAIPRVLPCKIYFSPERGDILYFGSGGKGEEGMRQFNNACMMVCPGPTGFGVVKRVAVNQGVFSGGKGTVEMNLRTFWERVRGKFGGVEEVVFVERGEDALIALEKGREEGTEVQVEGPCHADDGLSLDRREEERFEEKIQRVVSSLEQETEWVAPRWRVIPRQQDSCETQLEGKTHLEGTMIVGQARKEKEDALMGQMRELFGHEDVSNAF